MKDLSNLFSSDIYNSLTDNMNKFTDDILKASAQLPDLDMIDELPSYEDSQLREAVDDLDKRISLKLEKSARHQNRVNAILIIIGFLTLVFTILGVCFK